MRKPSIQWKHLRSPRLWVAVLLVIFGLWTARSIPLSIILKSFRDLDPIQLTGWVLLNLAILFLISSRWWMLLRSMGHDIPFIPLTAYRLASFAISYFTPGPQMGGEALQVILVQRRHQVPSVDALSTVALDKMIELFGNFVFICVGGILILSFGIFPRGMENNLLALMAVVLTIPAIYLAAVWNGRHPLSALVSQLVRLPQPAALRAWLNKSIQITVGAETQVTKFFREKPGVLVRVLLISMLIWLGSLLDFALALRFIGLQLPLVEIVGALTIARIAFLVPTPGGLGALEASQMLAMQAFGLSPALGISLSLLIRGRDLLMGGVGLGLISWMTR